MTQDLELTQEVWIRWRDTKGYHGKVIVKAEACDGSSPSPEITACEADEYYGKYKVIPVDKDNKCAQRILEWCDENGTEVGFESCAGLELKKVVLVEELRKIFGVWE